MAAPAAIDHHDNMSISPILTDVILGATPISAPLPCNW